MSDRSVSFDKELGMFPVNWLAERKLPLPKKTTNNQKGLAKKPKKQTATMSSKWVQLSRVIQCLQCNR